MPHESSNKRYEFDGEIARGGMGVVLRVKDRDLDRTLAMKRMLRPANDPEGDQEENLLARFLDEAQITAQLDHPSIVPIHDLGTDEDGSTYYTMRLVKGREFGEVIREVHQGNASAPSPRPVTDGKQTDGRPPLPVPLPLGGGEGVRSAPTPSPPLGAGERDGERGRASVTGQGAHRTGEEASAPAASHASRWNLQRALGVMVRVCQAVAFAHGKGVIHRDLKPANIMVGDLGEVYVMDWGLARMAGREETHDIRLRLGEAGVAGLQSIITTRGTGAAGDIDAPLVTMDGAVIGTPAYMPPEQAAGAVEQVNQRSDIYALGAILYELLAGHPPYMPAGRKTSAREVLNALITEPPERVRRINRHAPPELAAICEKSMERDPGRRYANCVDLAEDLQAYLDQRVVRAYRTGAWIEAAKWIRRNRATAAAIVAALVIGVGALLTILLREQRSGVQLQQAFGEQQQAADQALRTLADSYVQQGLTAADDGRSALAALWFVHAARLLTNSPAQRDIQLLRARLWTQHSPRPWRAVHGPAVTTTRLRLDPSQRHLMADGMNSGVLLTDLESEAASRRVKAASFHPAQPLMAVSTQPGAVEIRSLDNDSLMKRLDLGADAGPIGSLAYNADGTLLFIGARESRLWEPATDQFRPVTLGHTAVPDYGLFSPDNRLLLTTQPNPAGGFQKLSVFALTNRTEEARAVPPLFEPIVHHFWMNPVFAGNGSQFVHLRADRLPVACDVWTGRQLTKPLSADAIDIDTSPATASPGKPRLVSSSRGHFWTNLPPPTLPPDPDGLTGRFTPDGDRVALGSRDVRIVSMTGRGQPVGMDGFFSDLDRLVFTKDGTSILTAESRGLIRLWRLPPARGVIRVEPALFVDHVVTFHPTEPIAIAVGTSSQDEGMQRGRVIPGSVVTGQPAGPPLDTKGRVLHANFSPDGNRIVTLSAPTLVRDRAHMLEPGGRAGNLQLWDWRRGERLLGPVPMPSEPRAAAFHGTEPWLAVLCAGGEVLRVDAASGETRLLFKTAGPIRPDYHQQNGRIRFEAGADILAVSADTTLALWNVASNRLVAPRILLEKHLTGWDVHGDVLAVATYTSKVRFFNLRTGQPAAPDLKTLNESATVEFTPDGRHCLIQSRDGARLWDWRTGTFLSRDMGVLPTAAALIPNTPWCVTSSQMESRRATRVEFWHAIKGRWIAPPIDIEEYMEHRLRVAPSGTHALLFGYWNSVAIDLKRELEPAADGLDDDDRQLLAEINATARIESGALVKLTENEWRERWTEFRRRHPAHHAWR